MMNYSPQVMAELNNLQNKIDQADEQIKFLLEARKKDAHEIAHWKSLALNYKGHAEYWQNKAEAVSE